MTQQYAELITYKGDLHVMDSCPLNQYLKAKKVWTLYPRNSDCRRGYHAKWEIIDDKLYLLDLSAFISAYHVIGKEVFFPGEEKVFADWFTGELKIFDGEVLGYVEKNYSNMYEREIYLELKEGVIVKSKIVDNVPEFNTLYRADIEKQREEVEKEDREWLEKENRSIRNRFLRAYSSFKKLF